jgi:hypothetical protein
VNGFAPGTTQTDIKGIWMRHRVAIIAAIAAIVLAGALFSRVQFGQLAHPLLWHDEALTAVFGERVLEYGYPKVHGPDGQAHYPMHHDLSVGTHETWDAYIGSPWLQYYFAAAGVAWAKRSDDLYEKTRRVRLPFALAGCAGLMILLLTGLSALHGIKQRLLFAALYLGALSYSVLLVLHLREVRYYALTVLLVACAVSITAYRDIFRNIGGAIYTVALAVVCLLLFNSFYLAFVGLGLGLAINALLESLPDDTTARADADFIGVLLPKLGPLILAALAAIPLLYFYEVFDVAAAFSDRYATPKNAYGYKLLGLIKGLLRYEFLAAALVFRAGVQFCLRTASSQAKQATAQRRQFAQLLACIIVCYAAVVAFAPFYYERYSIALSPLITLLLLIDGFTIWDLQKEHRREFAHKLVVVICGLTLLATLFIRFPEFSGRLAETSSPIEGPLDQVVAYITANYEHPEDLVIATNYEDPSLRFYLGSQVVIGWFNPDVERDLAADPDIIIPRPGNRHLDELKLLASKGSYAQKTFPLMNTHANNVPSLAPWNHSRWVHRFATPKVGADDTERTFILERTRP